MNLDNPLTWHLDAEAPDLELLTRDRLIARWQHGSDSFFWRAQESRRLVPRQAGGLLRYAWPDVLAFEGGPPPAGLEAAYRRNLLTEDQVAAFCACSPGSIVDQAKSGLLPCRRIGRAYRFVPAEVELWQARRWRPRSRRDQGSAQ